MARTRFATSKILYIVLDESEGTKSSDRNNDISTTSAGANYASKLIGAERGCQEKGVYVFRPFFVLSHRIF
jgi:hypothetical protein